MPNKIIYLDNASSTKVYEKFLKAIALLTKFHTKEEFKEADFIIESLND